MWIRLLYFAQTLIWMRGILQLPVRREKKYYALAATVLAAFFIWGYTVGYGGNDAIVWMGAEYLLMLLIFAKRAGEQASGHKDRRKPVPGECPGKEGSLKPVPERNQRNLL